MNVERSDIRGECCSLCTAQPFDLRGRSKEALDPVCPGYRVPGAVPPALPAPVELDVELPGAVTVPGTLPWAAG